MKVAFIGASKFGLRCLEKVANTPHCELVGIVTNRETFSISYSATAVKNVLHSDFKPIAEQLGAPVYVMQEKMTETGLCSQLLSWKPDLILVVGWYHMVPKAIRSIAPAVGLHASLLPDYSGGAPLVWAMIHGEEKTGISMFYLDEGVDSGPLIGQAEEQISKTDTIATLYARIEDRGLELLEKYLPQLAAGTAPKVLQDESRRRVFPQRSPEDGLIDWSLSATQVYDFIRAQTRPYPGAFTVLQNSILRIWSVRICERRDDECGKFLLHSDKLFVSCGAGRLLIENADIEFFDGHIVSLENFLSREDSGSMDFFNVRV